MKAARRLLEPSALELIEEAVHVLRLAPARTLLVYYAGAVPFVMGLLFFWAHMTWFQPAGEVVAWAAGGLVLLFAALKAAQAEFCAQLMAGRLGQPALPWSWRRFGRVALTQLRVQSWALVAQIAALVLTVPFGWVHAYAQNLVVLADEEHRHEHAAAQALLWPGQNHVGLLLLSLLSFGVWLNLGAAFVAVPWLANRLLGIENIFGFTGWWFLNTTFIASVTALTWLAMDPLVKAFYTLRVFHGRARATGEDVRVELQLARSIRRPGLAVLALLLLAAPVRQLRAAVDAAPVSPAVAPAQLDQAIERVLSGPDFRWRLRPAAARDWAKTDGPVKRFVRQGVLVVREILNSVGRALRAVIDWFERQFRRNQPAAADPRGSSSMPVLRLLLYGFIAVAVLLIVWVVWLIIRGARRQPRAVLQAQPVGAAVPDLRDENVQAADLPTDGWLAMAREQSARGEWRLAWRALYLALLSRLAADGLIALAKFKTNLDYEREVRRHALSRTEIITRFAARRRGFEAVWYGRTIPDAAEIKAWMAELEQALRS
jgi:hypothetical protein